MKLIWRLLAPFLLLAVLTGCTDLTVPPTAEHTLPLSEVPGMLLFDHGTHLVLVTAGQQREVALSPRFSDYVLSPDGLFLTGIAQDLGLLTLDLRGNEPMHLAESRAPKKWAWSTDSNYLAVVDGGERGQPSTLQIFTWDGRLLQVIPLGPGQGRSIAWAPDSKRLAVALNEGITEGEATLWLVDWEQGSATLQAEQAWSVPTSWSPDGQRLAYGVTDKTFGAKLLVREPNGHLSTVISTDTIGPSLPHLKERFDTHVLQIYNTFWSPDGKAIYLQFKSASRDPRFGMFRVATDGTNMADWVLPVYPELSPPNVYPARACIPAFPTLVTAGTRIASIAYGPGCDGTLAILDAMTLKEETRLTVHPDARITPSPDRNWLAVTGPDHTDLITLRGGVLMRVTLESPGQLLAWVP